MFARDEGRTIGFPLEFSATCMPDKPTNGAVRRQNMVYLGEEKLPVTDGEEGGVGEASFTAGDTEGGVEERTTELEGAASSESP